MLGAERVEVGSTLRRHWVLVGSGWQLLTVRRGSHLPFPRLLDKRRGLLPLQLRPGRARNLSKAAQGQRGRVRI